MTWSTRLRRVGPIVGIAGAGVLCGAAPAPDGTEVTGGIAGGRYTRGGCGGYRYNINEGAVYAQVRGRAGDHVTWDAETSVGVGQVTSVQRVSSSVAGKPELAAGDLAPVSFHAARLGVDLKYGGGSLGPALFIQDELSEAFVVPSGTLWLGKRDLLYAWGGYFSGPLTGANLNQYGRFGLGHTNESWSLEVGSNVDWGASLDSRVRLGERLWLGAQLYTDTVLSRSDHDGIQVMGTVTFQPK